MERLHLRGIVLPDDEERDLWVVDGRLSLEPVSDATTIASGGWLIPGLTDMHCHIGLAPEGHFPAFEDQERQALADRATGALLLRDAGSPVDNRAAQQAEHLPRLVRAGRHIARTRRYIKGLGVEVEPEDLVAEVERQAARADGWVKIVGDWIDREVGDLRPLWPDDVLAAAVQRAHQLGMRVATHVFGEHALPGLVAAGVDSLEHATGLTADLLDDVAAKGIAIVPTLVNIDNFPGFAAAADGKFDTYARHVRELHRTSRERVRAAWEAGVPVYTGTDAGGSLPHGYLLSELRLLVEAGLPQDEVLAQSSWRGRDWLGLPGIEHDAPADLVVYDADPRRDLATLQQPRRMLLRGRVVA